MTYTARYQVFLSSTYTDLKEERAEVIQALWELDCIPTGMEAFLASNMSQWDIIQRVIDQCDYYLLIIGGRYGSVTEGISYTEKEFNYAKKIGLPILAFVHSNPDNIASGKSESDTALREKLLAFRSRVMKEYPVREWTNAHELGGVASRSLIQEMRRTPRPGWIRNDGTSPIALLEKINSLSDENQSLKDKLSSSSLSYIPAEQLSSGEDKFTLFGTVDLYHQEGSRYQSEPYNWEAVTTWDRIFRNIGPILMNEDSEKNMKSVLSRFFYLSDFEAPDEFVVRHSNISHASLASVLIQLRALGLIDKGVKKRQINDRESYWKLTDHGDRYLVTLMAKRKDEEGATTALEEQEEQLA